MDLDMLLSVRFKQGKPISTTLLLPANGAPCSGMLISHGFEQLSTVPLSFSQKDTSLTHFPNPSRKFLLFLVNTKFSLHQKKITNLLKSHSVTWYYIMWVRDEYNFENIVWFTTVASNCRRMVESRYRESNQPSSENRIGTKCLRCLHHKWSSRTSI